jgi:hypothetical protein
MSAVRSSIFTFQSLQTKTFVFSPSLSEKDTPALASFSFLARISETPRYVDILREAMGVRPCSLWRRYTRGWPRHKWHSFFAHGR